ncbi:hypothetical protein, partial [Shimia sp.]|uniref:hypothetical protein n=1 Tax=Shimia sp. TaxID=1954381 RepID=UPI00356A4D3E
RFFAKAGARAEIVAHQRRQPPVIGHVVILSCCAGDSRPPAGIFEARESPAACVFGARGGMSGAVRQAIVKEQAHAK